MTFFPVFIWGMIINVGFSCLFGIPLLYPGVYGGAGVRCFCRSLLLRIGFAGSGIL